ASRAGAVNDAFRDRLDDVRGRWSRDTGGQASFVYVSPFTSAPPDVVEPDSTPPLRQPVIPSRELAPTPEAFWKALVLPVFVLLGVGLAIVGVVVIHRRRVRGRELQPAGP